LFICWENRRSFIDEVDGLIEVGVLGDRFFENVG
jgi:hypothetical protein